MKLLFGGEQFLVRRLIFLVDRQRLLVDRRLLFARNLEVTEGVLEFGFRRFEFPFELDNARDVCGRDAAGPTTCGSGSSTKQTSNKSSRSRGAGMTTMLNDEEPASPFVRPPGMTTRAFSRSAR